MLIGLIGLTVFASVSMLIMGIVRRVPSTMESRIMDFRNRTAVAEEETDLRAPFGDRGVRPGIEAGARAASSVLPQSVLSNIQKQLVMSGTPMSLNTFVAIWAFCVVFMTGFVLFAVIVVGGQVGLQQAAVVGAVGLVGLQLPRIWLSGRVKARQKEIIKALPDALDLVTTCVAAGLGLG